MKHIPLDKSWMIRMGVLDMLNGHRDIIDCLNTQEGLGDDMMALKKVAEEWNTNNDVDVGESGTLYRFVRFALWKQNSNRKIIKRGTLKNRNLCDDKEIVNWPLEELLKLDNGTSQWASASVLMGNKERMENPPYKLEVTYRAKEHWVFGRKSGSGWKVKYDDTIEKQAKAYIEYLKTGKIIFNACQPEDYCFARAFDLITAEEGEKRWPSLKGHETNRIDEMERALSMDVVDSKDHRVVQALVMKYKGNIEVIHRDAVNKTWPEFWEFIRSTI